MYAFNPRQKAWRCFWSDRLPSNHPIIKEDGLLSVFLTEPSFESWRKHTTVSLEEESTSKRVSSAEEMSIPSDLDEKLLSVPFF
jgi:sorting nexin-8